MVRVALLAVVAIVLYPVASRAGDTGAAWGWSSANGATVTQAPRPKEAAKKSEAPCLDCTSCQCAPGSCPAACAPTQPAQSTLALPMPTRSVTCDDGTVIVSYDNGATWYKNGSLPMQAAASRVISSTSRPAATAQPYPTVLAPLQLAPGQFTTQCANGSCRVIVAR